MKKTNKLLAMFLVLSLVFSLLCLPVSAAKTVPQGKTATVVFTFEDVAGVSGSLSYSNKDIFSAISAKVASNTEGDVSEDKFFLYTDDAKAGTISFILTLKLNAKAKVNDICEIMAIFDISDEQGNLIREDVIAVETVKVVEADAIDLSELEYQLALADGCVARNYTPSSWAVFSAAKATALAAKGSSSQSRVDGAARDLEAARLALVALDYSNLEAAIGAADTFFGTDEVTSLIEQLMEAVLVGSTYYVVGGVEQADLDATATQILELIDALKVALSEVGETKIVEVPVPGETVTVEVPVEVTTEIEVVTEVVSEKVVEVKVEVQNKLFLVLFIITAVLLVVLIVLAVLYLVKKKNTETDTTPLVDYRIEDDDN